MAIINEEFTVTTKGKTDIIDITSKISNIVYNHQLQSAVVFVYAKGSTVSITNIEFEPGLLVDLPEALDKIAPNNANYHHYEMWHILPNNSFRKYGPKRNIDACTYNLRYSAKGVQTRVSAYG